MTTDEFVSWANSGAVRSSEITVLPNVELDVEALVGAEHDLFQVVPCRNGNYSIVSDEFDRANPVPLSGAQQYHTDGLYCERIPDFSLLYCEQPGALGIRTLFADTRAMVAELKQCGGLDRIVAYDASQRLDGSAERRYDLVATHPFTGESVAHLGAGAGEASDELGELLEQCVVLRHEWSAGDLVLHDNHTFVHGREAAPPDPDRRLIRVWLSRR